MAYDKDSNIGQLKATLGPDNTGQTDLFKQNLNALPLNQNQKNNLPLNGDQRNSLALSKDQRNNLALNQDQRSSTPLGKDVVKIIDMLSMDQFGHNISKLRKDLSIVDARQVNSDKEYGILQLEQDYQFIEAIGEPVMHVTPSSSEIKDASLICYSGTITDPLTQKITDVTFSNTDELFVIPNIFYTLNNEGTDVLDIDSIQYVGNANSLSKVNGKDVTPKTVTGTITNVGVLINDMWTAKHYGTIERIEVTIDNKSDYDIYIYAMFGDSSDYTKYTFEPNRISTRFVYGPSGTKLNGNFAMRLGYPPSANEGFQITAYHNYTSLGNVKDVQLLLKKYVFFGLPECYIKIRIGENYDSWNTSTDLVFDLHKATSNVSTLLRIGSNKIANVYDFQSHNIMYADKILIPTSTNEVKVDIVGTDMHNENVNNAYDTVFMCSNNVDAYPYWINAEEAIDKIISYHKLYNVLSYRSIGVVKRESGLFGLAIKDGGSIYTATNGVTFSANYFVKKISIISNLSESLSFTIVASNLNGDIIDNFYCQFKSLSEYSAGKLYKKPYHNLKFFDVFKVVNGAISIDDDDIDLSITSPVQFKVGLSSISVNEDVYIRQSTSLGIHDLSVSKKVTIPSNSFLGNSILSIIFIGEYVSSGLTFPMSICSQRNKGTAISKNVSTGRKCVIVYTLPSVDSDTGTFKSLPLRMEDEYPSIFNGSLIGDKVFTLGKTMCVSSSGSLYGSSELALVGNVSNTMLSKSGTIFESVGFFFLVSDRLTSIYTFTELGMDLVSVIEDEIICDPVKISIGIIAVGKHGIWVISKEGVRKLWHSKNDIAQASLKTDLDNCCIAIIDAGDIEYSAISSSNNMTICSKSGNALTTGVKMFISVSINQFGSISSQQVHSEVTSANFIDIGDSSKLILIDVINGNAIYNLTTKTNDIADTYSISSNQNIEMYGESVVGQLIGLEIFAKGTGTIDVSISSGAVQTVIVNSPNRYSSYKVGLSEQMNMLDYTIEISSGVKIMQRILGKVILMEKFNG